ncbi:SDR family NAD(P)-dependent oxidoreductase [archaeon]|nr:MAG: SDR family NAD(P)-dependent oxidoreductase [archaeon]
MIFLPLDLSSLSSVRTFATLFQDLQLPLHALINNAGLMLQSRSETKDGYESMFQCNHLGHFLLTVLLLQSLRKTGEGRVVTLTSVLHKFPKR